MGFSAVLFALGAALGSFLNVVTMRYDGRSPLLSLKRIGGRSHCPDCGQKLKWYELIPVLSFILQLGRCRSCGRALSWQYLIVEILSGAVFVLTPTAVKTAFVGIGAIPFWYFPLTVIFLLAALILIAISAIDARLRVIPDECNVALLILGIAVALIVYDAGIFEGARTSFISHYALLFGFRDNVWLNRFASALIGALFFGLIILLSRGRGMGIGDLKMAGAAGFLLGWPDIGLAILIAFISGAFWGIILILGGKKKLRSSVPFGPFIALGIFLAMFWGKAIIDAYFKLFP